MIRLDKQLLDSLDVVGLDAASDNLILRTLYDTLEYRCGLRLARAMSDSELAEFEEYIDADDQAGALRWLEERFPDYKEVVTEELDGLKREIADNADLIVQLLAPAD